MEKKPNIGFAITGSFCTHEQILQSIGELVDKGYAVYPIVSDTSLKTNTRFGTAKNLIKKLEAITSHKALGDIVAVEPTGPQGLFDVIVVAPCTGNTLAKIANGINDTSVTMAVKAHIRNNKPVVIGISTNDGMGMNFKNLATLFAAKTSFLCRLGKMILKKSQNLWLRIGKNLKKQLNLLCAVSKFNQF